MVIAAPVIEAEMADWVALGGGNSGIVGDAAHTFGFHCAAQDLGADDYSRWRDPNGADGPFVDWRFACAGDFSHKNDPVLRAYHVEVLSRLMKGDYPMICEFIGKPWADQPVLYWARWNGIDTLQKYTGTGHDTWSHISWYRSRVNEPANLWKDQDMPTAEDIAAAVWGTVWRSPDYPNPNNVTMGDMIFAGNKYANDTWGQTAYPPMLKDLLGDIQASVDALQPGTGGLPPHKHEPGEVMPA